MSHRELQQAILEEFYHLLGITKQPWLRWVVAHLMRKALDRFIEIALQFDALVDAEGFPTAARWVLPRFVQGLSVHGLENIPAEGPLLIAANHPGAVDSLIIPACLRRNDLRILASGLTFFRKMPSLQRVLIFIPRQGTGRAWAAREAIRHLRDGGSLLIYPSGGVDADPSLLSEARSSLNHWSRSLAIFLQHVPHTRVQTVICSHVLLKKYFHHPIARLGKTLRQRLVIAEFLQMGDQLHGVKKMSCLPCISFGEAVPGKELLAAGDPGQVVRTIIHNAQQLLDEHIDRTQKRFLPFSLP